ncbi:MAG: hypothetical protein WDZ35_06710 [Crocinitomicaceae bacterium]
MLPLKYIPLILLFLLTVSTVWSQKVQQYTFEGFFRGSNLNVQCREKPTKPWSYCDCFDSIAVNRQVVSGILYEGYQVDISNRTKIEIFDTVSITFYYQKGCDFRIINPNEFLPKIIDPVDTLYVDEENQLHWRTSQNYPQLRMWVQIEQYKWGEWVKIGPNFVITEQKKYEMDISPFLFKGENEFRAVVAGIDHERLPSEAVSVKHKGKKVKYRINDGEVYFSKATHYELYDKQLHIADRGYGDKVSLINFNVPDGEYILRFSNKEVSLQITNKKFSKP